MSPSSEPAAARRDAARRDADRRDVVSGVVLPLVLSALVGLAAGVLTSYGQGWLPHDLAPLANSATSWAALAALLALTARSAPAGALCAVVALLGMDAGYGLGSTLRGLTYSVGTALFWAITAVVVGPVLGAGVHWVRQRRSGLGPLAAGALAGVVVGEALYGLTVIAATTSTAYWAGQLVVGLAGLAGVCVLVLRGSVQVVTAVVAAAVVAGLFVVVYALPLILPFSS